MNKLTDIYDAEKLILLSEDKKRVEKILSPSNLSKEDWKKINYQVSSCGFSEEEVLREMFEKKNEYFKYLVLRKPTEKQAFQERVLIDYLFKNATSITGITDLPNRGPEALWIRGGLMTKNKPSTSSERATKSIDFVATMSSDSFFAGTTVYGIAKRTQGEGGAQDNQHHDVINSLQQAVDLRDAIVVAVLDGTYWEKTEKSNSSTRRDKLSSDFSSNPHIVVTDYRGFDLSMKAASPKKSQ